MNKVLVESRLQRGESNKLAANGETNNWLSHTCCKLITEPNLYAIYAHIILLKSAVERFIECRCDFEWQILPPSRCNGSS